MSAPLRDRFGIIQRLNFYAPDALEIIITSAAKKLKLKIDEKSKKELAQRARGTPRIALKLLKRARDFAEVRSRDSIDDAVLEEAFGLLEIDNLGLDDSDRRLLKALIEKHEGGPVGIETLAATLSEDIGTLEEVIEPFLMQTGLLKRTPRGREVTEKAYRHLNLSPKKSPQQQKIY